MSNDTSKYCPCCKNTIELTAEFWYRNTTTKDGFGGWCKKCHNDNEKLYRRGIKRKVLSVQERFWNKVKLPDAIGTDECWEWQGGDNGHGYGICSINSKIKYCHRIVYEWFYGPIPNGLEICHTCHTRRCVNPAHLTVDTHYKNMRDASDRYWATNKTSNNWWKNSRPKSR